MSQDRMLIEEKIKSNGYNLQRLAADYDRFDQKKYQLVIERCELYEELFNIDGKPINTIARVVLDYLNDLGIIHNFGSIYTRIDNKYKRENIKQLAKEYSTLVETESLNTPEEDILEDVQALKVKLNNLPKSRQDKLKDTLKEELIGEKEKGVTEGDFGIHQQEPPEGMQGPTAFSEAVRGTARWFELAADHFNKIADEIETYKPQTEERINQKAKDWIQTIGGVYKDSESGKAVTTGSIIGGILNPIFILETAAESDRKFSTSKFHWIGIIKNRIEQSKHGAGKMAENFITDPWGKPIYNKKGKPINKSISRERVGDFEWPIVDEAEMIIKANAGLFQLHDWLENDQGGHRRLRKELLHDYFAEASMGSIKSGNPEYEQFMKDYMKKQKEKFKVVPY